MSRLATIALLSVLPVIGATIDRTDATYAPVHSGAQVRIEFAAWNYGLYNPSNPYPTSLNLEIVGVAPDVEAATIPGTSLQYYPGFGFEGRLESLDGTISVPLGDPLSEMAGMGAGLLLVTPGEYTTSDGTLPVSVIHASVYLSPEVSQALFGPDFKALFVLGNAGGAYTIGIGPGYTVRNAVNEPDMMGSGPWRVGGITESVMVSNPEPGTWALGAGAAVLLLAWRRRAGLR
jgi:MYXO-CTERM domain-containing protein